MLRELLIVASVLAVLLLVAPAEPPVNVGTVADDAMAPTIAPGDAYLVTDSTAVAEGDVIRFWSATRGAYLTRRVVERSGAGFVTSGDAIAGTDQSRGLPPVHRSAVSGVVYERGGQPVTVPLLGYLLDGLRSYRVPIVGLLVLVGAFAVVREERIERGPARPVIRVRNILLPLLAVGVVTTVAITPLGAATYQLSYVATADGAAPGTIPADESVEKTVTLPVAPAPWERQVVRGTGVTVDAVRRVDGRTEVTVTIPPPDDPRTTRMTLQRTPYPKVLPAPLLEGLHDRHPLLAVLSGIVVLFGPLLLAYWLVVDGRRPVAIPRWRWLHRLLGI